MNTVKFESIENENLNIEKIEIDEKTLNVDIKHFLDNDIIIIKSGTGTGKTWNIAKISKELKEKTGSTILSIVNLISLSREQVDTFHDNGVKLFEYTKDIRSVVKNDGVVCINSLYKLFEKEKEKDKLGKYVNDIDEINISNKILYIDEVNDLINSLIVNDALDPVLSLVYSHLIELIKKCKNII